MVRITALAISFPWVEGSATEVEAEVEEGGEEEAGATLLLIP